MLRVLRELHKYAHSTAGIVFPDVVLGVRNLSPDSRGILTGFKKKGQ